jgi:putative heme-binding domain-containing protein
MTAPTPVVSPAAGPTQPLDTSSQRRLPALITVFLSLAATSVWTEAQTLQLQLQRAEAAELATEARQQGDAVRGAIVFFQPYMACSKCHAVGDGKPNPLGPDLALVPSDLSDAALVESLLLPSKTIRKGYEQVIVATKGGQVLTGILVDNKPGELTLRDIERNGVLTAVPADQIEQIRFSTESIMPAGQINQLAGRQQFLDLIRYLIDVRDGGAARARALQPPATLLTPALPDYEQRIDHAGFINGWDTESLNRGKAIYQRVCANCHGTADQAGSLPTSPRFATASLKNGSDPFAVYQTLTRGFGMMPAQTWMVPAQKYDVIHYIRETYFRPHNPSQFVGINDAYLAGLPRGNTRGPLPSRIEPWSAMDYGPSLTHTYEVLGGGHNFAYKGIAVRLDPGAGGVARGRHWMIFDTDTLRAAAAWSASGGESNFIDWRGVQFTGEHQIHPHIVGQVTAANATGPGWANPDGGRFRDDQRVVGRDGRRYGPLPRSWGRLRGTYYHGQRVVISYTVGATEILESPRLVELHTEQTEPTFVRLFHVGPRDRALILRVADHAEAVQAVQQWNTRDNSLANPINLALAPGPNNRAQSLDVGIIPSNAPCRWLADDGQLHLEISAGSDPVNFALWMASGSGNQGVPKEKAAPSLAADDFDLHKLIHGGPPRWPERLSTRAILGDDHGPFAVDVLTAPEANPWLAQTRFTGLDFMPDRTLAVCTWDGDVWLVRQSANTPQLEWQRIASGLFQPLGLKIVNGKIHVLCRDQLAVLHDLNGDGEIDFYQCLNNDHQVTEHFHEFAMGLQTDASGNFYYAKSARHALPAVVPQHGTLLRVSKDGTRTDILANGFRAANGVCLNPDGSFVVTDQEGHWNPKNRINWVTLSESGKPKFYGNLFGYSDTTDPADAAMEPPLCWITNDFDRSPAELLWVESDRWGPLKGSLLNLSYGYGKVYVVPHECMNGRMQGGMLQLPIPLFPTGVMRGRFSAEDGHLYLCGMFAWAGSATQPGGLYRLRATGQPMNLVVRLHATQYGLKLTFTDLLDPSSIEPRNVKIKTWSIKRTAEYGSKHYNEKSLTISGIELADDGRSINVGIPDIQPTWCMEIAYQLRATTGEPINGVIHNTIHTLAP